ncbi:MAG: hypothetical protein ACLTAT_11060 [Lachnospira eligens]
MKGKIYNLKRGIFYEKDFKCIYGGCINDMRILLARYMGVGFTTHDNFDFSVNIQRGDFVSLDVNNDGDWDHMGFVTNVDFMYEDGYHYQENERWKIS